MARPVVHYEIIGTEPGPLRDHYAGLFGWRFDTSSPVSDAVSDPDDYGFVQAADGGILGGVGGGSSYPPPAIFHIGVDDVEASLQEAERLGGTRVLGPAQSRVRAGRRALPRPGRQRRRRRSRRTQ